MAKTEKAGKTKKPPKNKTVKPPLEKRREGRPTKYSKELAAKICREVAISTKGLTHICADNAEFPSPASVYLWRLVHKEFSDNYAQAKRNQADLLVEEIIEISDNSALDVTIDDEGNEKINHEIVARARLRVDTRKWIACKLLPKVYGDKSEVINTSIEDEELKATVEDLRKTVDLLKKYERDY